MAITINGTGSITGLTAGGLPDGSVVAADLASSLDLTGKTVTLPSGTGGKVLQIESVILTNAFNQTITSTSSVISGFTVDITKVSSTSDILVLAMLNYTHTNSYARFNVVLTRGGTPISVGTSTGNRLAATLAPSAATGGESYGPPNWSVIHRDEGAGAGTHTYDFRAYDLDNADQTISFNRGQTDSNTDSYHRTASTIVLLEIEP